MKTTEFALCVVGIFAGSLGVGILVVPTPVGRILFAIGVTAALLGAAIIAGRHRMGE